MSPIRLMYLPVYNCYKVRMPGKRMGISLLAALLALALVPTAAAALTVANTNDSGAGSLRAAIEAAPAGETISIPAGTYTLSSGELKIAKSLSLSGAGAGATVIRSGGPFRVVEINGSGKTLDVAISGMTIRDGHDIGTIAEGGGISSNRANLTLRSVVLTANVADASAGGAIADGGAVYSEHGKLTVLDSVVSDNLATVGGGSIAGGGGLYLDEGLVVERSRVSGNIALAGVIVEGGGVYLWHGGASSALRASTVNGNTADATAGSGSGLASGGGIYVGTNNESLGATELRNLTVTGNVAKGEAGGSAEGGGIYSFASASSEATIAILDSTIAANRAEGSLTSSDGGNLYTLGPRTQIGGSIVSGGGANAGAENCRKSPTSQPLSLGFNLESSDQCGFHAGGDRVNLDPQLGPLASNGGPTATMALPATSPGVDRGSAFGLATDQRGVIRPIEFPGIANAPGGDGSDVGAFELQPSNALTLGELTKNKKKGTATLVVNLPQPGTPGTVALFGIGLKTQTVAVNGTQPSVTLDVRAAGKKIKKALRRKGKRKVQIEVSYAPAANVPATATLTTKLIRKHKHRHHKKKHPHHPHHHKG
jgi:hypothetical protein